MLSLTDIPFTVGLLIIIATALLLGFFIAIFYVMSKFKVNSLNELIKKNGKKQNTIQRME